MRTSPRPVPQVRPVAPGDRLVRPERRRRDPRDEERRDDEGRRVDPVRRARPPGREQQAGRRRPDRPRDVLDRREERGRLLAVVVRDEVREPGPDRGTEEAGRDPVDRRERDDQRRLVDERQRDERPGADEIGDDHQAPPRESVDERAERDADHDDRQEVRDQERRRASGPTPCGRRCRRRARVPRGTSRPTTPAVAQKRSAKLGFRLSGDRRPVAPSGTVRRYHRRPDGNSGRNGTQVPHEPSLGATAIRGLPAGSRRQVYVAAGGIARRVPAGDARRVERPVGRARRARARRRPSRDRRRRPSA